MKSGLVLARKRGESIVIVDSNTGQYAEVTYLERKGDQIKLMIDAPSSWKIHRPDQLEKMNGKQPIKT